ncbi:MAG: hypothetical protein KDE09_02165 [Anaerolineales bacterium]|nr:hypothetical protein [Anaerolineales bacterium]MCB0005184.1 hypothetical protein [Anaerolineales bacterium]MCB0016561.1 hypothetical protein [Anaerolineales bacterium]MCB8962657.1 hypothetical protein [Ardenticatenales bacterium]
MTDLSGSFKSRHVGKWFLLLASMLALLFVGCNEAGPDVSDVVFKTHNNGYGFKMLYPENWTESLISQGLMAFGEAEDVSAATAAGTAASTVVVFRRQPQAFESLQAEFARYVEGGPEASGFVSEDGIHETTLDGRQAFEVLTQTDPELIAAEDRPDTTLYIIAVYADNGVTYYVTATAPTEDWEEMWPIFQVMIASFEVLE